MRHSRGFTLIELVITMVVASIVSAMMALFLASPVQSYTDQSRRAALVDAADGALRVIARDVRRALPNSVRVNGTGTTSIVELMRTTEAVRYRSTGTGSGSATDLDFGAADGEFTTLGKFTTISRPFDSTAYYLAVYNVGVAGADAYELANVITPQGTRITIDDGTEAGTDRLTMAPAFQFAYSSPSQRVFLVEGPVAYLCDNTAHTLTRFTGYTPAADSTTRDSASELIAAGAVPALIAGDVAGCSFDYAAGSTQRAGLLTAALTVSRSGEQISLLEQVHVVNTP
jgi:MSHA biogenesis protein MshO